MFLLKYIKAGKKFWKWIYYKRKVRDVQKACRACNAFYV